MKLEVKTFQKAEIDISEIEALHILCKTLEMEFVLDEDREFYVNESGEIWESVSGCNDRRFDDRGDLFIALRNVAVNIVPNVYFRNEPYIYRGYQQGRSKT